MAESGAVSNAAADLDPVLLEVLACPVCRGSLDPRGELLVCRGCGRGYPVRDGVPVLLEDDATPPGESGGASA